MGWGGCAFSEMSTVCVCVFQERVPWPGSLEAQARCNQRISVTAEEGQGARGWDWGVGKGWGRAKVEEE